MVHNLLPHSDGHMVAHNHCMLFANAIHQITNTMPMITPALANPISSHTYQGIISHLPHDIMA
jgi:hypothetical protein